MQKLVLGALALTALVGVAVWLAESRDRSRAEPMVRSGTLPMRETLHATYNSTKCPAGTPQMTNGSLTPCYLVIAHGTISSLGKAVDRRLAIVLHSATTCPEVRFRIALTVAT